jgi:hypothetical protein
LPTCAEAWIAARSEKDDAQRERPGCIGAPDLGKERRLAVGGRDFKRRLEVREDLLRVGEAPDDDEAAGNLDQRVDAGASRVP